MIRSGGSIPADELWFNPGDDLVYAANNTTNVLNVVNPETRALIQTLPDVSGRNQAAFAENNHVFTPVRAASGDQCSQFGFVGTGCVAVFAHKEVEKQKTLSADLIFAQTVTSYLSGARSACALYTNTADAHIGSTKRV